MDKVDGQYACLLKKLAGTSEYIEARPRDSLERVLNNTGSNSRRGGFVEFSAKHPSWYFSPGDKARVDQHIVGSNDDTALEEGNPTCCSDLEEDTVHFLDELDGLNLTVYSIDGICSGTRQEDANYDVCDAHKFGNASTLEFVHIDCFGKHVPVDATKAHRTESITLYAKHSQATTSFVEEPSTRVVQLLGHLNLPKLARVVQVGMCRPGFVVATCWSWSASWYTAASGRSRLSCCIVSNDRA